MTLGPPRLAERLIAWSLPRADHDAILGDLLEEFRGASRRPRPRRRSPLVLAADTTLVAPESSAPTDGRCRYRFAVGGARKSAKRIALWRRS